MGVFSLSTVFHVSFGISAQLSEFETPVVSIFLIPMTLCLIK